MILILEECKWNYKIVARLYRERYPDRRHPMYLLQLFSACAARTICQI